MAFMGVGVLLMWYYLLPEGLFRRPSILLSIGNLQNGDTIWVSFRFFNASSIFQHVLICFRNEFAERFLPWRCFQDGLRLIQVDLRRFQNVIILPHLTF